MVRLVQRVIQVSEVQLVLSEKPVLLVYRFSATEEFAEQLDVQVNCYNILNHRRRRHGADGANASQISDFKEMPL